MPAPNRVITAKIKKKMLDKEIPYGELPQKDLSLYHAAELKEWLDWLKNESVTIVKGNEAKQLRKTVPSSRIISLRFVYRDKNASIRTPQHHLPVKAKARLCAQGSREPMSLNGMVKLDSPTVQRIGIMIFLQPKLVSARQLEPPVDAASTAGGGHEQEQQGIEWSLVKAELLGEGEEGKERCSYIEVEVRLIRGRDGLFATGQVSLTVKYLINCIPINCKNGLRLATELQNPCKILPFGIIAI